MPLEDAPTCHRDLTPYHLFRNEPPKKKSGKGFPIFSDAKTDAVAHASREVVSEREGLHPAPEAAITRRAASVC
jgi:hypothetical protein